jgi:hypothetical protein
MNIDYANFTVNRRMCIIYFLQTVLKVIVWPFEFVGVTESGISYSLTRGA